jgi:hypothetical protein
MHPDLFTAVDDRIAEGTVAGLAFRVVALGNDCDLWLLHRGATVAVVVAGAAVGGAALMIAPFLAAAYLTLVAGFLWLVAP